MIVLYFILCAIFGYTLAFMGYLPSSWEWWVMTAFFTGAYIFGCLVCCGSDKK